MKKIIVFFALCAMALCASSCIKQAPGLSLSPEYITIKVGESRKLTPSVHGFGIDYSDVRIINPSDGVCRMDDHYFVKGQIPGTSRVGIGVPIDKDDVDKGMKYEAYTEVTVVE